MKLSRVSLMPLLAALLITPAATAKGGFHALVSSDSRNCYTDAMTDASHARYQPALAKLESLLMTQPVSVGVEAGTVPADCPNYKDAVAKGMGIWHDALSDSPFITAETTKKRPMVLIKFVKDIDADGGDLQGMIEAEHEFKWSSSFHTSKLVSTMYVVYRTEGRNLSQSEVSQVVAHELGHLLGLTDAYGPKGLMGPFVAGSPRLAPSQSEVDAVNGFRQTVRDAINDIENKA